MDSILDYFGSSIDDIVSILVSEMALNIQVTLAPNSNVKIDSSSRIRIRLEINAYCHIRNIFYSPMDVNMIFEIVNDLTQLLHMDNTGEQDNITYQ